MFASTMVCRRVAGPASARNQAILGAIISFRPVWLVGDTIAFAVAENVDLAKDAAEPIAVTTNCSLGHRG